MTHPLLCTEARRYDQPDPTYRFFWLEPHEVSFQHMNYKPFADRSPEARIERIVAREAGRPLEDKHQNYIEANRQQVDAAAADQIRGQLMEEGYRAMELSELPERLVSFVIHSQLPIEFQRQAEASDPAVTDRVRVWVHGDLGAAA